MKVRLMHADRDFDPERPEPPLADDLAQDLELDTLVAAMADGDARLAAAARAALLDGLREPAAIARRRAVLRDCHARPDTVRELHALAAATVDREREIHFGLYPSPDSVLNRSVHALELFTGQLRRLRAVADARRRDFSSAGFTELFDRLAEELDDAWFREVDEHLKELRFKRGVLVSAGLGRGLRATGHVLRRTRPAEPVRRLRLPGGTRRAGYTFTVDEREPAGAQALEELRGRGINLIAEAVARSADHILGFFQQLRDELAFFVGCLNLRERLAGRGGALCEPADPGEPAAGTAEFAVRGLYDPCLALALPDGARPVANDVDAGGRPLILVTGANQGGKSTFLRSLGLAQLMFQAGMFVCGDAFRATPAAGLLTHYRRGEDASMTRGKLEEELARMSAIADRLGPGALLLCNESFAATNEREGSEIARQVLRAVLEAGVRVVFVTHLYDLADGLHRDDPDGALFLRAERRDDGGRTYRLTPGAPLPTSYGEDLYRRVFADA